MGDRVTLKVDARDLHGKKVKNLRKEGLVPGVVYGPGIDPVSIQVPEGELRKTVEQAGKHTPVHLTGVKRRIAMVKDVEFDATKNTIQHISFHAVKADEPVTTEVAIRLIGEGESEAEKAGLIILQNLDRIEIKALPMDLPEALELSTTHLKEEGERVTVGDITLPENVEFVEHIDHQKSEDDEDEEAQPSVTELVVATVREPSALQAANEAAGGDAEDESEVEAENGGDDTSGGGEEPTEEKKEEEK